MSEPTPQLVRDFWKYMTGYFGSTVVNKGDSLFMITVADSLNALHLVNKDTFLQDFTTTIRKTIYVPFELGVPSGRWSLWEQMVICVHEHQHVIQYTESGIVFAAAYLASTAARADYEMAAYRCNMTLDSWRTGLIDVPDDLADRLTHYGCSADDISATKTALELSGETIAAGGIPDESSQIAIAWLGKYAEGLIQSRA